MARWWFQTFVIFTPICGKFPFWHILTNIFQVGWNHQPDCKLVVWAPGFFPSDPTRRGTDTDKLPGMKSWDMKPMKTRSWSLTALPHPWKIGWVEDVSLSCWVSAFTFRGKLTVKLRGVILRYQKMHMHTDVEGFPLYSVLCRLVIYHDPCRFGESRLSWHIKL